MLVLHRIKCMYINFEEMAQLQMSVLKGPPVMRPVVNRYGVQLLMLHPITILKPKESTTVSDVIMEEILEGMCQVVGLDTSKDLTYTHTGTN